MTDHIEAQGETVKAARPWYKMKRIMIPLVLVALIFGSTMAGGGEDNAEKIGTASTTTAAVPGEPTVPTTAAAPPAPEAFKLGDVISKGTFEAVAMAFDNNVAISENDFVTPEPGKRFVAVEFQLKNTGTEPEMISTLLQFKLRDGSNAQYDAAFSMVPEPRFPEGELSPGATNRGWVTFEVPEGAKDFSVVFDSAIFGGGRITWVIGQ